MEEQSKQQIQPLAGSSTKPVGGLTAGNTNTVKLRVTDGAGNKKEVDYSGVATKLYTWEKYKYDVSYSLTTERRLGQ